MNDSTASAPPSTASPSGWLIVVAAVVIGGTAWGLYRDRTTPPPPSSVEYVVTGSGGALLAGITYASQGGSTSQLADAALPWTFTMNAAEAGNFLYVSAQNASASGCVQVRINIDGRTARQAESCGAHVIATAQGALSNR